MGLEFRTRGKGKGRKVYLLSPKHGTDFSLRIGKTRGWSKLWVVYTNRPTKTEATKLSKELKTKGLITRVRRHIFSLEEAPEDTYPEPKWDVEIKTVRRKLGYSLGGKAPNPTISRLIGHEKKRDIYEDVNGYLWEYTGTKVGDWKNPEKWKRLTEGS